MFSSKNDVANFCGCTFSACTAKLSRRRATFGTSKCYFILALLFSDNSYLQIFKFKRTYESQFPFPFLFMNLFNYNSTTEPTVTKRPDQQIHTTPDPFHMAEGFEKSEPPSTMSELLNRRRYRSLTQKRTRRTRITKKRTASRKYKRPNLSGFTFSVASSSEEICGCEKCSCKNSSNSSKRSGK